MYMVFVVDGNKNNTFQSLMEVLEGTPFTGIIIFEVIPTIPRAHPEWKTIYEAWSMPRSLLQCLS